MMWIEHPRVRTIVLGHGILGGLGHGFELGSAVGVTNVLIHHLRIDTETIDIALSVDLADDPLVVVVAKRTAELIVAHVPLVLVVPPPDGNGVRLVKSKLSLLDIGCPLNQLTVLLVEV